MQQRTLGGEAAGRSFFGGTRSRTRTGALIVVALAGSVLTLLFQLPGILATLAAAALIYIVTANTHTGSLQQRWANKRRWKERGRLGLRDFQPVARRPAALDPNVGTRTDKAAGALAWNAYRDWPDGAEGMHWLQRERGVPGIAWHTPTGEAAYLSVVFAVSGQVRGVEGDHFLDGCSAAFGQLLARYGSPLALPNRVQTITRVLPTDSARHEAWVMAGLAPDAPRLLLESYDQVVKRTGRRGLMQRHYVVIRWPLTPTFIASAQRLGRAQHGWRQLMAREVQAAGRHLVAARLGEVAALSAAQTAAVLRHMQIPSWPIDQAADVDVASPWCPTHDEWSYTVATDVGPTGQVESWFHRTALVPIAAVETGPRTSLWLAPLLSQLGDQIVRTISIQTELVPAAEARADARTDVTSDLADLAAQREKGILTDDDLKVGLTGARARLDDLTPGSGHHGAGWAMHITISARSRDQLADASAKIAEAAGNAGITALSWLDTTQAAAQACTWPIGRGMKPIGASLGGWLRTTAAGSGAKEALS